MGETIYRDTKGWEILFVGAHCYQNFHLWEYHKIIITFVNIIRWEIPFVKYHEIGKIIYRDTMRWKIRFVGNLV